MRTIVMPVAGKSSSTLTIRKWFKQPGELLGKGDLLAQAESMDGLVELESAQDGVLGRILIPEGKTVASGTAIAEMENGGSGTGASEAAPDSAEAKASASALPAGSVIPVMMPQVGNSMEEGTLVRWIAKVGDRIKVGQEIFEIETDKATVAVEATEAGRLAKIVAGPGAVVAVKSPVAYLAENDADVAGLGAGDAPAVAAVAATSSAAPSVHGPITSSALQLGASEAAVLQAVAVSRAHPASVSAAPASNGSVKASPLARKIAREGGLDLASVRPGSGPGGRILSTDLANAKATARAGAGAAAGLSGGKDGKPAIAPVMTLAATEAVRRKMSKMRKAIGANLQMSKQTVPHFYLRSTLDAGPIMAWYRAEKAKYPCSLNDAVTLACAKAIIEFPALRSKIDKDEIVEYPSVNIGVAVGVEDGLTVPVLLNAHAMDLRRIAENTRRIVESARAGKLEGFGQGNFTITNLGMYGVEEFAAIVNPPEPGILAVGSVREDVIVKDGALRPGKVMTMTLSCDHRLVDGLLAAKFMARLKELLENPAVLV